MTKNVFLEPLREDVSYTSLNFMRKLNAVVVFENLRTLGNRDSLAIHNVYNNTGLSYSYSICPLGTMTLVLMCF